MIAFGCAITEPEVYDRCAKPGIELAAEPDSAILALGTAGSIFRNYNLLLDRARELDDLEALVIVHQDAEIIDSDACAKLRLALSDPDVGIVGCAGAVGVRSIAWWEGSVTWAAFTHRYRELGGGEIPSLNWLPDATPSYSGLGEVDSVDGFVLGFSPRALAEVRFDESLGRFHGYDYDICLQTRAAGMKVVTADIRTIHHHSLELITEVETWIGAHMRLAEKWEGRFPDDGYGSDDWVRRARHAEAEASAARLMGGREKLVGDAVQARDAKRIAELEDLVEEVHGSTQLAADHSIAKAGRPAPPPRARAPERAAAQSSSTRRISARVTGLAPRLRAFESFSANAKLPESSSIRRNCSWRAIRSDCWASRSALRISSSFMCVMWSKARRRSIRCSTRCSSKRASRGLRSKASMVSWTCPAHGALRCQMTPSPKNAGTVASFRSSRSARKSSTAVRTPLRSPPS